MDSLVTIFKELCSCASPHITLVTKLKSNVESLEGENKRLVDIYRDVTNKVEGEEQNPLNHRLEQVKGWLEKTPPLTRRASEMVEIGKQELQNRWLWGQCPKSCLSSYRIARSVEKQLAEVKKALAEGQFEVVTYGLPYHLGEVRPQENMEGNDLIFQEVWRWINDDNIAIIGLYGMGGIGKTTLLTKINNELTKDCPCSKLVIWVTVNQSGTVESVQQAIRNRLNLEDENWSQKTPDEKCTVIYQFLRGKEFVLLLDDLWERLDLSKVGIPPLGQGKCKLVFTTRSKQVCGEMGAKKTVELEGLADYNAKALFNSKVGEETLNAHPEIPHLAEVMAMYCGGLPVALVTIGRAMSGKTDPEAWRRALRFAKESLSKIASMECQVYPLLKLSYDSLSDGTMKECFLYCALFPQGFEIPIEFLIRCWIKDGILLSRDEHGNTHHETSALEASLPTLSTSVSDQGSEIIETLKRACMLETGTLWGDIASVKMHDVIRDMALWILDQQPRNWIQSKAWIHQKSQQLDNERLDRAADQFIKAFYEQLRRAKLEGGRASGIYTPTPTSANKSQNIFIYSMFGNFSEKTFSE